MDDQRRAIDVLKCTCGEARTAPSMLLHLLEGNCIPTETQAILLRKRLSVIHTAVMAHTDAIENFRLEGEALQSILRLQELPVSRTAQRRPCSRCGKLTTDRFGERAQCLHHNVTKTTRNHMVYDGKVFDVTDEEKAAVKNIISKVLHGKR